MTVALALLFVATGTGCAMSAQQDLSAMTKLHWMEGSWTCSVVGTHTAGLKIRDHVAYRFVAGGQWMEEVTALTQDGKDHSSIQMWGFDPAQKRLVAYQFTAAGIATKSVDGWQGDTFVSHRDDNGATVSIVPKGARAFDWLIVSADHSNTVREECTR